MNKIIFLILIIVLSAISLYISFDLLDTHISALGFALFFLIPNQVTVGLNTLGLMWILNNSKSKLIKVIITFLYLTLVNLFVIISGQYIILFIGIIPILLGNVITIYYSEQSKFTYGAWIAALLNFCWIFLYYSFNI